VDGWYKLGNFSPARKWAAGMLTAPVWVPVSFLVAPRRALLGGRLPGHVLAIYWAVYLAVFAITILVLRRMGRRGLKAAELATPRGA